MKCRRRGDDPFPLFPLLLLRLSRSVELARIVTVTFIAMSFLCWPVSKIGFSVELRC